MRKISEAFSEEFPFELTRDQADTVAETPNDLSSEKATDRLICGDVGFGKTEVALRAALVAVQNRKQIAAGAYDASRNNILTRSRIVSRTGLCPLRASVG